MIYDERVFSKEELSKHDNSNILFGFFLGVLFTFVVAFVISFQIIRHFDNVWRDTCVEKGVAKYVVDKNGNVEWFWTIKK